MCGSEFPEKTTPLSLQSTELISSELYTVGNINLHTAEESITSSDTGYQLGVDVNSAYTTLTDVI